MTFMKVGGSITPGSALQVFLTETNNDKFVQFKKKYYTERKLFNKMGLNYNIKYFRKYDDLKKIPKMLELSSKEKQKTKTFMPKYYSKYLEKNENILKRLKKECDNFDYYIEKTVHSTYTLSELFVELFNQKKLLESKIARRFDNLKEIFSSTNKFFINLGTQMATTNNKEIH